MFGFGWESDDPVAPIVARRGATDALVARMNVRPDAARSAAIDQVIATLSDAGIWAKLDVFVVLAAHNAQAALLNWKGAPYSATTTGAPAFVADRGFFTDGSDDAINWGWAPANGVSFTQNAGMFGAWFRKGDRNPVSPVGTQTGTTCALNPRSSSDAVAGRINSTTVSAGGTAASGHGLAVIDRSSANAVQCYRNGAATGVISTAASATRSPAMIASGKAAGVFADGQFGAHFAGASLTAAEHRILADALSGYMNNVGSVALPVTARTLALAGASLLPDGAHPVGVGRGMGATGLARDPVDGCWWVANGIATPQPYAGVTRLSPDMTIILGAYTVADWGLPSSYYGSMQGVTFDTSDATLWAVLKATSGGGSFLLHFARSGVLIGAPVALPQASANGIAHDPARDLLAILYDTSPGTVRWFSKAGVDLSASNQVLTLPSNFADHICFDPTSGDLLASWGDNGSAGTIGRYSQADYGGYALHRIETLSGADAIEGIVLYGGSYHVINDGATHPGTPIANRILRYWQ